MKRSLAIGVTLLSLAGCSKQAAFEGLARTQAFERYKIPDGTQAYIDTIHVVPVGDGWDSFLIKITPTDTKMLMAVHGGIIALNSGKGDIGICVAGVARYKGMWGGYDYKTSFKIDPCK